MNKAFERYFKDWEGTLGSRKWGSSLFRIGLLLPEQAAIATAQVEARVSVSEFVSWACRACSQGYMVFTHFLPGVISQKHCGGRRLFCRVVVFLFNKNSPWLNRAGKDQATKQRELLDLCKERLGETRTPKDPCPRNAALSRPLARS